LLDECLPRKLGRLLIGHQVTTVPQAGLAGLKNGALLASAAGRFAVSNRMEHLAPLVPQILAVLPTVVAGQIYRISAASP
jgi:hypothetical protein